MTNTPESESCMKYERDYLLQLRMHPLSLQKPTSLPNIDVIKDKLYLHQIINSESIQNVKLSHWNRLPDPFHSVSKEDRDPLYRFHSSAPMHYQNSCSYYPSRRRCNATCHSMIPSGHLSSLVSNYGSSHRKQHWLPDDYKIDMSHDDVFTTSYQHTMPLNKQPNTVSEHTWNAPHRCINKISPKDSENQEHSKESSKKKKLMIIDPTTGENILDTITKSSPPSQDTVSLTENASDLETEGTGSQEMIRGDHRHSDEDERSFLETTRNGYGDIGQHIPSDEEFLYITDSIKKSEDNTNMNFSCFDSSKEVPSEESGKDDPLRESSSKDAKKEFSGKLEADIVNGKGSVCSGCSKKSKFNEQESKQTLVGGKDTDHIPEISDVKDENSSFNLQKPISKDSSSSEENSTTLDAKLKTSQALLREKTHFIEQEQQKLAILQSFLRFKKHQLDESFRNFEDIKIDMANWEFNLVNKAKRLQEKEIWLDSKKMSLRCKERQLEEREQMLVRRESNTRVKCGEEKVVECLDHSENEKVKGQKGVLEVEKLPAANPASEKELKIICPETGKIQNSVQFLVAEKTQQTEDVVEPNKTCSCGEVMWKPRKETS